MTVCGSFTMSSIPNGEQDSAVNGLQNNIPPPTSVTAAQQPDGTWTVTAQWPPCPDGVSVSHSTNNL